MKLAIERRTAYVIRKLSRFSQLIYVRIIFNFVRTHCCCILIDDLFSLLLLFTNVGSNAIIILLLL